jgi:hypothetical protein
MPDPVQAQQKNPPPPAPDPPKISRENYNRILNNMTIEQVEAILGPGKENLRVGTTQVLHWNGGFLGPSITVTFESGFVKAKSIMD